MHPANRYGGRSSGQNQGSDIEHPDVLLAERLGDVGDQDGWGAGAVVEVLVHVEALVVVVVNRDVAATSNDSRDNPAYRGEWWLVHPR